MNLPPFLYLRQLCMAEVYFIFNFMSILISLYLCIVPIIRTRRINYRSKINDTKMILNSILPLVVTL